VSALAYPNLNPFREALIPIFREKMFNKKEFLKESSCIEPTLRRIGQGIFFKNWPTTEGAATYFKNQKSTFCKVLKSFHYFEKILVVLNGMRDCLEIARTMHEKEILGKKVIISSGVTERHIQEIVFMFNYQLDPIFRNCQTSHKDLFK
jgi:hypothetical protein